MKVISAICFAVLAVTTTTVTAVPQCSPNETEGYLNCKSGFQVSGSGSDALWCISESDCAAVFPTPVHTTPTAKLVEDKEEEEEAEAAAGTNGRIDAVQEAVVESAAPSVTSTATVLVAASAIAAMLC
mmetsp:Transcript_28950/g.62340  ORF Transcript_28950/g.62340 Transcript_28950/m.62340 type:complete len:128 (+) Transcript_28950:72-455(+)